MLTSKEHSAKLILHILKSDYRPANIPEIQEQLNELDWPLPTTTVARILNKLIEIGKVYRLGGSFVARETYEV